MTQQTKMPEPVAWRSRYCSPQGMIGHYPWSYVEHSLRQPTLNNYNIESLITTEQAEVYAAAKVREALEAAIKAAESCNTSGTIRSGTIDQCVEAIRVLIPA